MINCSITRGGWVGVIQAQHAYVIIKALKLVLKGGKMEDPNSTPVSGSPDPVQGTDTNSNFGSDTPSESPVAQDSPVVDSEVSETPAEVTPEVTSTEPVVSEPSTPEPVVPVNDAFGSTEPVADFTGPAAPAAGFGMGTVDGFSATPKVETEPVSEVSDNVQAPASQQEAPVAPVSANPVPEVHANSLLEGPLVWVVGGVVLAAIIGVVVYFVFFK
ncbi:MAG: hypothetical protein ACM3KH_00040 [Thiobacillus sp.]